MNKARELIGSTIRELREQRNLSQEVLAEKASITYQYLSGLENGQKNFTIGVLENLSFGLKVSISEIIHLAYNKNPTLKFPEVNCDFLRDVPLPSDLTLDQIADVLNDTQKLIVLLNRSLVDAGGRPLPSYIQKNNFSGIVSNILTDSFDRITSFKHNSEQAYPDLISKKTEIGLEVKSTINVGKGGESHNGHTGWHLIACFRVDETYGQVRFIHLMFANLISAQHEDSDWKYLGSRVNEKTGSQRTETYTTTLKGTTKLRDGSAYLDPNFVKYNRWHSERNGNTPKHSIFWERPSDR